jgi:hypothetical protein
LLLSCLRWLENDLVAAAPAAEHAGARALRGDFGVGAGTGEILERSHAGGVQRFSVVAAQGVIEVRAPVGWEQMRGQDPVDEKRVRALLG